MEDPREAVKQLLREKGYEEVLDLLGKKRKVVRVVRSLLYEEETLLRWRAVSMMGRLAVAQPGWMKKEVERLLWSLNDEAGCIGRSAPEAIGEIARNNIRLARDAAGVVIEYLRDPETCRPPNRNTEVVNGVLWAIGRVGSTERDLVGEILPVVASFLEDPDPAVRGHAAWALGEIGTGGIRQGLEAMIHDGETFLLYEGEELEERSVGLTARQALQRMTRS